MASNVEQRVKEIICEQLGVSEEEAYRALRAT